MKKSELIILLILIMLYGCSGTDEISVNSGSVVNDAEVQNLKERAFDHFINGSLAQNQGDYSTAVSEFSKALESDTSSGIFFALGKNYLALNKLSSALKYARLAVEYDSAEIEYYNLLADVYLQARADDSAAVVLEKILQIYPDEVSTYYKLARIYEEEKPLQAIKIYEELTKIIGPDWNVLLHISELYEKVGYSKEATKSLEKLRSLDPSNLALQKLIIDFYQRNQKYDEALKMLDDIIELRPDDLDAREQKALIFIAQNKWEEAAEQYNYFLTQPSIPLDIKISIGASYFAKAVTDSSIMPLAKDFFETMDKDTIDWQVKLYLGAIAISQREDSVAIENFKYVTENARWNVEAWVRLGGLYFDNRKYAEAEKLMTEAIQSFPHEYAVNLILGLSLAQQGKNNLAKDYLKKSTELNPQDVNSLSAYGFTLSQLNENEEAAKYLNQALILEPDNVNLLAQLGLIYNNMNKMVESDSLYEKALRLDPENALVNNNYAYSLSERDMQLERALQMVIISIKADSLNSSYLDTIGWVYYKLGEYDKALPFIQQAIEVGGESSVMLEHLGDILFMQGSRDQALEMWKKALGLDSANENLIQKVKSGVI
ncbi:MAG TPA: tetratricopeptide repeat protein [Ignavibacteriaceae bacterium]|nr:tetratricopeptide repeat protein [Ignavibacteriaceae bacterium]